MTEALSAVRLLLRLIEQPRYAADAPDDRPELLAGSDAHQDDMLRLISITGAIRSNIDVVPQSLRGFLA